MNKILAFLLLCVSFTAVAQEKKIFNDPNAKVRIISAPFTKISVSSGVDLYITQGTETALAVSVSDEKYEDRFKTEIEDGVLKIYYDYKGINWVNDKKKKLKAYLSVKDIEKIKGSAGANVSLTNELLAKDLELKFSSGSIFSGKVNVTNLKIDINSGAEITASGIAGKFTASASSGAMFKGYELATEFCDVSANSGGAIKIQVQKELKASANSGGSIKYTGEASIVKTNTNSGGSVNESNK